MEFFPIAFHAGFEVFDPPAAVGDKLLVVSREFGHLTDRFHVVFLKLRGGPLRGMRPMPQSLQGSNRQVQGTRLLLEMDVLNPGLQEPVGVCPAASSGQDFEIGKMFLYRPQRSPWIYLRHRRPE